jgi:hypothetical protein
MDCDNAAIQLCSGEIGSVHVHAAKFGALQESVAKIGLHHACIYEFRTLQVRITEVREIQVGSHKFGCN